MRKSALTLCVLCAVLAGFGTFVVCEARRIREVNRLNAEIAEWERLSGEWHKASERRLKLLERAITAGKSMKETSEQAQRGWKQCIEDINEVARVLRGESRKP